MKNPRFVFWLGIIAIVLPLLGIPETWKHLILFIVGLTLIAMSLVGRNQGVGSAVSEKIATQHEEHSYTSKYTGPTVISEDISHTRMTNQYAIVDDEPSVQLVYADDADVPHEHVVSETNVYGFSDTVVQDVVPPKKPRKKRVSKKATVQNEMENPVLVSGDVAGIIDDIEETFDARN